MSIDILSTLTFICVSTFTPGPNNVSSAVMGALHGYRKTLNYLFGITAGFFLVMFGCVWVSASFLTLLPQYEPVLRYAGAGYILYLAAAILKANYAFEDGNTQPLGFMRGVLLQLLNPKLIIYGLTLFATFLAPLSGILLQLMAVLALALISFCAISSWTLFGTIIKRYLRHPRTRLAVNILLALFLVYSALELISDF
ncbi:MAG TPA: LysE family transporter [Chloroflexia bacterium]|nr:LysE family transporter [Chloroflexia bacterium]